MAQQHALFDTHDEAAPGAGVPDLAALPDAELDYQPGFLAPQVATALLTELRGSLAWQRDEVLLFGKRHPIPRLHQWYGDTGASYRWSGLTMQPRPWPPALRSVLSQVSAAAGCPFNAVLANLYRDGQDCMGWHADDEAELGPAPVIASLSLGATRDFVLRYRRAAAGVAKVKLPLTHGSLLVMRGPTQQHWQHALPRRKRVHEARINLTFRRILPR